MHRMRIPHILILTLALFVQYTSAQESDKKAATTPAPVLNKVEGLELPANQTVDVNERYAVVVPKFSAGAKVHQMEWIVVYVGDQALKYTDLGESGIIVAVPPPKQSAFVYGIALVSNKGEETARMTKSALTVITGEGQVTPGTPPPDTQPQPPIPPDTQPPVPPVTTQPTPIPSTVQGLSVVLVFDLKQQGNREIAELTTSQTLRQYLAQSNSKFFAYDKESPILDKNGFRRHITQTPLLFVVASGGKSLLPSGSPIPITPTGNSRQTELMILDLVGKAAGGR